jgi:type I restriction enzyme S subunit
MSFSRYPKYKDSGVEWLGEVPEHWNVLRLKINLRQLTAKTGSREHPVALENIESWSGRYIETETDFEGDGVAFQKGDILFGKLRPYLAKVYLAASTGEAVGDFHVLRPDVCLDGRFAQHQMLSKDFIAIVDSSTFGAKMPRVSWDFLGNMTLTTPPYPEQTAIAAFLDRETAKIDALVAEQEKLIALLKEKRQAVISHAVTKGLDPTVPMKDSGVEWLGDVPEHWSVKRLKHLVEEPLQYGANESGDASIEAGPRYIRITDLDEAGELRNYSVKLLPQEVAQPYMLSDGDILFARSGATVGKTYRYKREHGSACFAGYLIRARLDRRKANPDFVILAVRSHYYWAYIQRTAIPATIENVSAERYGDFPVALPNYDEQERIVVAVSSVLARIDLLITKTQHSITLLKERRSALISAAVTGKIDVRGILPSHLDSNTMEIV